MSMSEDEILQELYSKRPPILEGNEAEGWAMTAEGAVLFLANLVGRYVGKELTEKELKELKDLCVIGVDNFNYFLKQLEEKRED